VTGSRDNAYGAASQAILDVVYRYKNAEATNAHFLLTANLAVPAEPFRSIGGFNPHFRTSEDREFCHRWLISGKQMIYVPEAVVLHEGRRGLADFMRQHYGYGAGAYQYHKLPAAHTYRPRELEPWSFYAQLLAEPLQAGKMPRSLEVAALVFLSQFASACGYIASAFRSR
jgi:GT2 family glycosyltransferase